MPFFQVLDDSGDLRSLFLGETFVRRFVLERQCLGIRDVSPDGIEERRHALSEPAAANRTDG
jgi:hypothetical protein